jgi:hypothetical protein
MIDMAIIFPIWRRNLCAACGAIAGAFAGTIFGLLLTQGSAPAIAASALVQIGLILAVAAWIGLLIVLASWLHYQLGAVWLPALINAVLTAILTVLAAYAVKSLPFLAPILGVLIGTLVGFILCRFCDPQSLAAQK